MRGRLTEAGEAAALALQFLTLLPLPPVAYTPSRMAAAAAWFPLVGIVVGGIVASAFWLAASLWPPVLAALIATALGLVVTGALHEDGLADVCDGLGGGRTPERALEIMRDSRIGAYGALGLGLVLALKVTALAAMPGLAPLALIAGHAGSRAAMVPVIARSTYLRRAGAGSAVAAGPGRGGLAIAIGLGAGAVLLLALAAPWQAVAGGAAGLVAAAGLMWWRIARRLGGYTGDCLGAVQQAAEVGLYLGLLACL